MRITTIMTQYIHNHILHQFVNENNELNRNFKICKKCFVFVRDGIRYIT